MGRGFNQKSAGLAVQLYPYGCVSNTNFKEGKYMKAVLNKLLASLMVIAMALGSFTPMTVYANQHEHAYEVVETVAPTCENDGYTVYGCTGCEETYNDNYVTALGHDYYAVDTGNGTHRMVCRNDESHAYEESHEWVYQNKVLPTCTEDGYSVYVCGKCGVEQKRDYEPSLGHDYVWHDNENGSHTGICSTNKNHTVTEYCKEYYHDYVTEPTCTEQGYTSHICEKCGSVLVDSYVRATGHNYVYKDNGDGTHTGTCQNDPTHVEVKAHNMEQTIVNPTCTDRGYTHNECADCGYAFDDNFVPPTTHDWEYTSNSNGTHTAICSYNNAHSKLENCEYELEIVAPTCDNQGYDLHTCKLCGYSYKDNFKNAMGHDYIWTYNDNGTHTGVCRNDRDEVVTEPCDEVTEVVEATCTAAGYTLHTCEVCGNSYKDNYVDMLGHDYEYTCLNDGTHSGVCKNNPRHTIREACNIVDIVTAPTCTANGYTTHKCSVCGYSYVDSYVPALGHNHVYEDLGNGTHRVTCLNDPLEISVVEDHKYTVSTVNPTCEAEGYTLHTCMLCKYSYKDNIKPAIGHNYRYYPDNNYTHTGICTNDATHRVTQGHNTVNVVTQPTCEAGGYTTKTCTVCGLVFRDSYTPAKGHNWINKVTPATCTSDGYTTHTCANCGKVVVDSKVPAKGHNYKWVTDKKAAIGITGLKHEECANCGAKKAAVKIAALESTTRLLPVIKSTKNTQTISWNKIPGAKYYKVYGAKCGNSMVYLKTVKSTKWKRKKLKKGTYYKYYVVAVTKDGNKEVNIEKSISVHSTTSGSSRTNPTKLKAVTKSATVKAKKTKKIKATVVDTRVSRHVKRLRYVSSNKAIATVNSSGKVTAKKKGTCYIYVIAQNGQYKKVKITVK